jgi:hypothetical protein
MSREREELVQDRSIPEMPRNEMDGGATEQQQLAPLFDRQRADDMRLEWANIQAAFVDSPGQAVQRADQLVEQVLKDLSDGFARQRSAIESQAMGSEGQPASTESMRVALRRYRSFFERLLSL